MQNKQKNVDPPFEKSNGWTGDFDRDRFYNKTKLREAPAVIRS